MIPSYLKENFYNTSHSSSESENSGLLAPQKKASLQDTSVGSNSKTPYYSDPKTNNIFIKNALKNTISKITHWDREACQTVTDFFKDAPGVFEDNENGSTSQIFTELIEKKLPVDTLRTLLWGFSPEKRQWILNTPDHQGRLCLIRAVYNSLPQKDTTHNACMNNASLLQALIEAGADPTCPDGSGQTALQIVTQKGFRLAFYTIVDHSIVHGDLTKLPLLRELKNDADRYFQDNQDLRETQAFRLLHRHLLSIPFLEKILKKQDISKFFSFLREWSKDTILSHGEKKNIQDVLCAYLCMDLKGSWTEFVSPFFKACTDGNLPICEENLKSMLLSKAKPETCFMFQEICACAKNSASPLSQETVQSVLRALTDQWAVPFAYEENNDLSICIQHFEKSLVSFFDLATSKGVEISPDLMTACLEMTLSHDTLFAFDSLCVLADKTQIVLPPEALSEIIHPHKATIDVVIRALKGKKTKVDAIKLDKIFKSAIVHKRIRAAYLLLRLLEHKDNSKILQGAFFHALSLHNTPMIDVFETYFLMNKGVVFSKKTTKHTLKTAAERKDYRFFATLLDHMQNPYFPSYTPLKIKDIENLLFTAVTSRFSKKTSPKLAPIYDVDNIVMLKAVLLFCRAQKMTFSNAQADRMIARCTPHLKLQENLNLYKDFARYLIDPSTLNPYKDIKSLLALIRRNKLLNERS